MRKFNDYNMWWVRELVRGGDGWPFDWDYLDEEDEDDWVTAEPAVEGTNEDLHDEWWSDVSDDDDWLDEDIEEILYG